MSNNTLPNDQMFLSRAKKIGSIAGGIAGMIIFGVVASYVLPYLPFRMYFFGMVDTFALLACAAVFVIGGAQIGSLALANMVQARRREMRRRHITA